MKDRRPSPELQTAPTSPHVVSALHAFARFSAFSVLLAGCLALFHWAVGPLKILPEPRTIAGLPLIAPSAAFAFALCGVTLLLKRNERPPPQARIAGIATSISVIALGLLDTALYLIGWDPAPGTVASLFSVRIAPASAVLFIAAGVGLLFMDAQTRRGSRPAQTLFLVIALFTIAALGVSLFGAFTLKTGAPYASMTWLTALVFLFLSLGALSARPDKGALRVISLDAVGGMVARRLLPAALLAPLLLCIVCYLGFLADLYGSSFGLAILTTMNSAVLTTLVWRTSEAINVVDAQRRISEREKSAHQAEIEELNRRLQGAMAETHHRVRNNLQFISALADIQIMEGGECVPVSEVRRIESQVRSLAAVHDLLTREAKSDAGADTLWADEVLRKLAGLLQETSSGRVIAVRADRTRITGRQASAMVIVANELIVNALKYSNSDVEVHFEANQGEATLRILDDGDGFKEGFDPVKEAGTGLALVRQISGWDLQGEVRFTNRPEGGACVTLRMPVISNSDRERVGRYDS
jgi:two-component sensor histidine kinase